MTKRAFQILLNKYLSGQANPVEERLLFEWYDSFKDELIPIKDIPTPEEQRQLFGSIQSQLATSRKTIHRSYSTGRIAASVIFVLLAAGLAFYFSKSGKNREQIANTDGQIVATPKGRKQKLVLPDGTLVWLNADSKLSIPKTFGSDKREVFLKGEAYFEVKHQSSAVFIVHTTDADVRVLGTIFDVKAYPSDKKTEVSLLEGAVRVNVIKGNKEYLLRPEQKVVVDGETGSTTRSLSFINQRFDDLAIELERWFNIRIVFETEALKSFRFTGTLNDASLNTVMEALILSRHFNYRKEGDNILVVY